MDIANSVSLFIQIAQYCIPFVFVFSIGTLLVNMILRAVTGGKLRFD